MKMAPNYLQRTGYRLPTEAEWEFACRAGAVTGFYFGESEGLLPRYAWYQGNSQGKSWPVGILKPNDLGLFDMLGNAWEWSQDSLKPYDADGDGKATEDLEHMVGLSPSNRLVHRSGSFANQWQEVRSAGGRGSDPPQLRYSTVGFRPVRSLPFRSFDRYAAARAAALAAVGRIANPSYPKATGPLDDAAKAKLCRQALDWLKAELTNWSKIQAPRVFIARNLWQWQQERDLAGIRDQAVLAKLPPEEQKAFTQFWADVAKSAEPVNSTERLEFAPAAALIARQGKDEPPFDAAAKAKLRGRAFDWLKAELNATADRAGRASIIAAATPLSGLLERLAESAPNDGWFQADLARYFAEHGKNQLAEAARTKARGLFEAQLAKEPDNAALAGALADLLLIDKSWTVLKPVEARSELGATLSILPDDSILASGANPPKDRYRVVLTVPKDIDLASVRLEALTHPSLPANGPGRYPGRGGQYTGTFAQESWKVTATSPNRKEPLHTRVRQRLSRRGVRLPNHFERTLECLG